MHKKYLVIGASGTLGFRLAGKISRSPRNKVLGSWRNFELSGEEFPTIRLDLTEWSVGDLVREFKPDTVYHLASETNIDRCEEDPQRVYLPIQIGLFSLIDACNELGSKLVFISSNGIFGQDEGEHYEDTRPNPINVYGRAKVLSEGLIRSMSRRWVIVRCCPVGYYPLRQKGLICWIERQIQKKQVMTGWTDCRFNPLSVESLAEKLIQVQDIDNQIVHLHSYPGITKYDFLRKLLEIFGASPDLVRPGKMAESRLHVPRPRNQVLLSRGVSGIETAVPIEQEFELLTCAKGGYLLVGRHLVYT